MVDKNELGNIKLVFYEAKHFENSEIRARIEPKVVEQIRKYHIALSEHKIEIMNSYKRIFKNIVELNLNTKAKLLKLIDWYRRLECCCYSLFNQSFRFS